MKVINSGSAKFQFDSWEKNVPCAFHVKIWLKLTRFVQSPTRVIYFHILNCSVVSIKFIFTIREKVDRCKNQELLSSAFLKVLLLLQSVSGNTLNLWAELINKHTLMGKPFTLLFIWGLLVLGFMVVFILVLSCQCSYTSFLVLVNL